MRLFKKTFYREHQSRFLTQAAQLEELANPAIMRAALLLSSIGIIGFIVWAAMTRIDEVARTAGEVVPQGYQQLVQHLEGGIVRDIAVEEGQSVKRGQILLHLDGAGAQEDLERALKRQTSLDMQEERYRAFSSGRQPDFRRYAGDEKAHKSDLQDQVLFFAGMTAAQDEERKVISEQIGQKKHQLETLQNELATANKTQGIARDMHSRQYKLNQKGYTSDVQYLQARQRLNDAEGEVQQIKTQIESATAELREFETRLSSLEARYKDEAYKKIDEISAERAQNAELIAKLRARVERLDIRAPVDGLVKGLAVNTVGEVVQPGRTLMEIVPLDRNLVAEVRIPPQHIGHLKIGQEVHVKFSSYDFSRYGFVPGKLDRISATTFEGERGERFYRGRILLSENHVGRDPSNNIMPGMTVMADIVTGRKTILQYLLKPINNAMKTAFSER